MGKLGQLIQRRHSVQKRIDSLLRERNAIDKVLFARLEAMAQAADGFTADVELDEAVDAVQALTEEGLDSRAREITLAQSGEAFVGGTVESSGERDWITPAVTEVLLVQGKPMKVTEIYQALLERGRVVGGKNPVNNLSAHLSNREAFVSTPAGWTMRDASLTSAVRYAHASFLGPHSAAATNRHSNYRVLPSALEAAADRIGVAGIIGKESLLPSSARQLHDMMEKKR